MKRMLTVGVLCCGSLVPGALGQTQDVSGHWTGTINRGDRSGTVVIDLKTSGSEMTGSLSGPGGQVSQIRDWKRDGNQVTFTISAKEHGHAKELHFVGDVADNELRVHTVQGKGDGPTIVLHRREQ